MISKKEEQKWRAEEDARTMMRYQEILGDKQRKAMAIKVAKTQAADLSKKASMMQKVAGSGTQRKTTRRK